MMRILVMNLHCARNQGDAAIVYEAVSGVRTVFPDALVTMAATDPDSWYHFADTQVQVVGSFAYWLVRCESGRWQARRWLAPVIVVALSFAVVLYRLFGYRLYFGSAEQHTLLDAYYGADLVLSTGGGYFYANWPFSPFFIWSLLSIAFALGLRKRTVLLPQSIGPIVGRFQRSFTHHICERLDVLMVREQPSADFLAQVLKVQKTPVLLPDLAFNLPAVEPLPRTLAGTTGTRLRIGVTVIDRGTQTRGRVDQMAYEKAIEGAVVGLLRQHDAEVFFLIQCSGPDVSQDDRPVTKQLYERIRRSTDRVHLMDPYEHPLQMKAAYKSMDLLIASRMHAGILALSSLTPVILIAYQPKAVGTMAVMGLSEYCYDINQVTDGQLLKAAEMILKQKDEIRRRIANNYQAVLSQLRDWPHYLREVVGCGESA